MEVPSNILLMITSSIVCALNFIWIWSWNSHMAEIEPKHLHEIYFAVYGIIVWFLVETVKKLLGINMQH